MIRHLRGQCGFDEAAEQTKINTRQFAKHQRTWFRGFRDVHWIDAGDESDAESLADAAMEYIDAGPSRRYDNDLCAWVSPSSA